VKCSVRWVLASPQRITDEMRTITRDSIERKGIRTLCRNYGLSKPTVLKIIHTVTAQTKSSIWIAERFKPVWSGVLAVDGVYLRVFDPLAKKLNGYKAWPSEKQKALHRKVWLCGIDYGTGDLPHYALADEESMIDLVMFFRILKKTGYPLRVLVSDGNEEILRAARFVFGTDFLFQRCTRHYLEALYASGLAEGSGENPQFERFLAAVQAIIQAKDIVVSHQALQTFKEQRYRGLWFRKTTERFFTDLDVLTTHLTHPEIALPHTTNDIENLFRQVRQRTKTIERFGRFEYAQRYLNAWALWRRFTPYTDCRGKRRCRNKRAPLQLAGSNIVDSYFLSL
jgi:hypothetical protein